LLAAYTASARRRTICWKDVAVSLMNQGIQGGQLLHAPILSPAFACAQRAGGEF
jgi:hypothetical protein